MRLVSPLKTFLRGIQIFSNFSHLDILTYEIFKKVRVGPIGPTPVQIKVNC